MSISTNLDTVLAQLPSEVQLIAVSKTHPVEAVMEAYQAGQRHFGENKIQEMTAKYESAPKDIHWHMIGHVQSNKVKYMAPFVHFIHGVESLKLAEEINKQAKKHNRIINILLQVYIASEETKFGLAADELFNLLDNPALQSLENIQIRGLMGMASFTEDATQIRSEFAHLKSLFEKCKANYNLPNAQWDTVSMGMSGDYAIAVEEGSTMVRIGSSIFGHRNYN